MVVEGFLFPNHVKITQLIVTILHIVYTGIAIIQLLTLYVLCNFFMANSFCLGIHIMTLTAALYYTHSVFKI